MTSQLTRLFLAILVLGGLGAFSGCVALVPYTPKTDRLDALGEEEAAKKFSETLTRSLDPRFNSASVDEESFKAEVVGVVMGAFWQQHQYTNSIQVYFNNITRIEVYENNVVFLRGISNEVLLKATFPDQVNAMTFADLVSSFKARRSASSGN